MAQRQPSPKKRWAQQQRVVFDSTPERAVVHFRALRDAGIQYFIIQTLDAADLETIKLLAAEVVPRVVGDV